MIRPAHSQDGDAIFGLAKAFATDCRQQGIGKALMNSVEAWAAQQGSPLVALATRRASGFYEAIGYQASATYFRKDISPETRG